jgi:hypothetical protein
LAYGRQRAYDYQAFYILLLSTVFQRQVNAYIIARLLLFLPTVAAAEQLAADSKIVCR